MVPERRMTKPMPAVADGGWGWAVLLAAFLGQMLYSGGVPIIGIYLIEWQEHFRAPTEDISLIATLLHLGLFLTMISGAGCKRFGCRPVMIFGGLVATVSTLIASFSTKLWHLYLFAVVAGIGHSICIINTLTVPRFFFKRRLAMANGVIWAGTGCGLLVMAPVVERLCSLYGWQGAMLIHAALNANYLLVAATMRPTKLETQLISDFKLVLNAPLDSNTIRLQSLSADSEQDHKELPKSQWSFCRTLRRIDKIFDFTSLMTNRLFVALSLVCIAAMCGQLGPMIYLPLKLVQDLGFSKMSASFVISVYGMSSFLTRLFHGFLLDYKVISPVNLFLLAMVVSGILPILSPVVKPLAGHFALAVTFGLGTGALQAMITLLCREYVPINQASNAIGLVGTICGSGVVIGTQMTGKLFNVTGSYDVPFYICGALLWVAALMMSFVTKCLKWKPTHGATTVEEPNASYRVIEDDVNGSTSRDVSREPIATGYQPVPDCGKSGTEVEHESEV